MCCIKSPFSILAFDEKSSSILFASATNSSFEILFSVFILKAVNSSFDCSSNVGLGLLCISFFVYYDLQIINAKNLKNLFPFTLNNYKSLSNDFKAVAIIPSYGAFSSQFPAIINNISVRDGYEILNSNRILFAQDEENYQGEYFLESNEVKVNPIHFSPGYIKFFIFLQEDTVLHINGNYSVHWKATNGYTPYSENNLLSLKLHKAKNEFTLYYLSLYFVIGFILSLLGYLYFFIKLVFHSFARES